MADNAEIPLKEGIETPAESEIRPEIEVLAAPNSEGASETPTETKEIPLKPKKARKPRAKKDEKAEAAKPLPDYRINLKLFGKWPTNFEVKDPGLKPYINLTTVQVPYTAGRAIKKQFWKSKKSIVERLSSKLMVAGHKGKKHYWTSNVNSGKSSTHFRILISTFSTIEKKTGKNPIEVLVRALEACAPREGIATIEYGGVRYPKAADLAPQRRIDLCLRWIVQGAFLASLRGKKHMPEALADEIIATAAADPKANAIGKKTDLERQAAASR